MPRHRWSSKSSGHFDSGDAAERGGQLGGKQGRVDCPAGEVDADVQVDDLGGREVVRLDRRDADCEVRPTAKRSRSGR
jgi:hypothetical protein